MHIVLTEIGYESSNLINPLNAELNPICHLQALLGAHHILHVSRIRVNLDENREYCQAVVRMTVDLQVP